MLNKKLIAVTSAMILASNLYAGDRLNDVVITAKSKKQLIDTAGSTSIITAEEIEKMGVNSINEVLEETVGISRGVNNSSTFGRKTISIRGLESKNSLILIDGRRVSGSDAQIGHSDFQYNWLPLSAIEKIEVVRGPMSSLYGSNALGGVINIITKRPINKIESELDIKFGRTNHSRGGDDRDYSIVSSGKVNDKFAYSIFGQFNDEELTTKPSDSNVTDLEGKTVRNIMANGWFTIDDTQNIEISFLKSDEKRKTVDYDNYYDLDKTHAAITYNKEFRDLAFKASLYTTKSENKIEQFSYTHNLSNTVLNTEAIIDSIDKHFIIAGAEIRRESYDKIYDTTSSNAFGNSFSYSSAYLQDEIDVTNNLILTLGIRYDKHENFGGEISPKAFAVYKLQDNMRLKLGYGHGFNAPTVTQSSDSYQFRNYYAGYGFDGDSNLKPEVADSYELGFEYKGKDLIFKTTGFFNDVKNLIDYTTESGTESNLVCSTWAFGPCPFPDPISVRQYGNVDNATTKGIELEYQQDNIVDGLDFDLNYTYLKTEDKETSRELKLKPKHTLNAKISYELPYEIDSSLRYSYTGKQYDADYEQLDAYATSAMQLSKKVTKDLTVRFGIENLTDKRLDDDYEYQLRSRFYYAGLNYKF